MSLVNTHGDENRAREAICDIARSLYQRGYTHGSTGNISVRHGEGYLMTPTGATLGGLDPARLSRLDAHGALLDGDKPTKELFLHMSVYERRLTEGAVIHLHATHSTAVSNATGSLSSRLLLILELLSRSNSSPCLQIDSKR